MFPRYNPYIEISLDKLIHNLNEIRKKVSRSNRIIAVVKDNAYGCGAIAVARALEEEGVGFFAVANIDEARELRKYGINSKILIFGECSEKEIELASHNNISLTINDIESLKRIAKQNIKINLHINVNTGMNRLGISETEVDSAINILQSCSHLNLEGMFTHFPCADDPNTDTVNTQKNHFENSIRLVKSNGLNPKYIHLSNSAAIMHFPVPEEYFIRPGISIYGCKPDPSQDFDINLLPVASLKACIIKIKTVPAGTPISYGWKYKTEKKTGIATIPIGYAHGFPRLLTDKGEILIKGKRFPVVGTVTMDYIMADIGMGNNIHVGDEAVAIGTQGKEIISPDEIAIKCGTIGYEILCGLNNRTERFYTHNGKIISHYKGY